jgi:hypothetical protein
MVRDASHYIQFDRPDVVISAVREVVARVRARLIRPPIALRGRREHPPVAPLPDVAGDRRSAR